MTPTRTLSQTSTLRTRPDSSQAFCSGGANGPRFGSCVRVSRSYFLRATQNSVFAGGGHVRTLPPGAPGKRNARTTHGHKPTDTLAFTHANAHNQAPDNKNKKTKKKTAKRSCPDVYTVRGICACARSCLTSSPR